jgi:general secretion pathway protein A
MFRVVSTSGTLFSRQKRTGKVYVSFFNLREQPFSLTPDPRFLFLSPQHEEALSHLLYGIYERKGFIEITGEVGTGKTLLCRTLLERLDDSVSTALIFNSHLTEIELLQAILHDFGLSCSEPTRKAYIDTLNHYLLAEFAAGRNAVVIIDETQNLEATVLEQLRMLSNLETDNGKLLQVVLIGQPELRDKLATRQMRQLDQRIAVRYHIHGLRRAETRQYVTHRMSVAGAANSVSFSPLAWTLIHRRCNGIPRRINLLCDRILMTAYVRGKRHINASIVRQSHRDLSGSWHASSHRRLGPRMSRLVIGTLAGVGLVSLLGTALMATTVQQRLRGLFERPQILALTQPTAALAPIPAAPVHHTPSAATPVLAPQPAALAATDLTVAQTLWRLKKEAELAAVDASTASNLLAHLQQIAETMGLDVVAFNTGLSQLTRLSRPCLLEIDPESAYAPASLWVLLRVRDDEILIYREPEGVVSLPRRLLLQRWYGQLYLTLEADKYRGATLTQGMHSPRIQLLQHLLQGLGYFPGSPSGSFDTETLQAVKAFQRDNQLAVDGRVGPRTLIMLFHVGGHLLSQTT